MTRALVRGRLILLVLTMSMVLGVVAACASTRNASPTCASVLGKLAPVTDTHSRRATGSTIEVDGANAGFDPTCVTGVPRGDVTLTVRNAGLVLHNVEIASRHIDVDIARGQAATVHVRVGSEPVVFVCKYHRSIGMLGVLIPGP